MMGEAGWVMLVTNQYISVTQGNVLRSPYCKNELFAFVWLRTLTNQDLSRHCHDAREDRARVWSSLSQEPGSPWELAGVGISRRSDEHSVHFTAISSRCPSPQLASGKKESRLHPTT